MCSNELNRYGPRKAIRYSTCKQLVLRVGQNVTGTDCTWTNRSSTLCIFFAASRPLVLSRNNPGHARKRSSCLKEGTTTLALSSARRRHSRRHAKLPRNRSRHALIVGASLLHVVVLLVIPPLCLYEHQVNMR